jgi:hypothetical protein
VKVYDWHCEVKSGVVTGMRIDGEKVEYTLHHCYPDKVFATKEEAEAEGAIVLAEHEAQEVRRFNHVKDHRHKSWAWNVSYHRRCAKEARRQMEYHESRLAVAKAKAKTQDNDALVTC